MRLQCWPLAVATTATGPRGRRGWTTGGDALGAERGPGLEAPAHGVMARVGSLVNRPQPGGAAAVGGVSRRHQTLARTQGGCPGPTT